MVLSLNNEPKNHVNSLGPKIRIMLQLLKAYWQVTLTYRGSMLVRGFHTVMMPFILSLVWLSVPKEAGAVYQDADYLYYYLMMPLMMNLTACFTVYEIPEEIRNGTLNQRLLKPFPPLLVHVSKNLAEKTFLILHLVPVLAVITYLIQDRLPAIQLSLAHLALTAGITIMAMILRFLMTTSIAMSGFWIEHVETLNLVLNAGVWAFLGGMIVPIETLPGWLRVITDALPYRYSLSFPIEVFRGGLTSSQILFGIGIMILWMSLFLLIVQILWRRGLRIYTAYGG